MINCRKVEPGACADVIWRWFEELPRFVKRTMDREADGKNELVASFAGGLNFLIERNDSPLMFVNFVEKLPAVFDTHLFCPRRTNRQDLYEGMAASKAAMFARSDVGMLVFDFLSRQRVLRECLARNGAEFSGYRYVESGKAFEIWTLQKSLINFQTNVKVNLI